MPRPRKIDQLSEKHRDWLRDEIVKAGYGDYEEIAENLNARLKASGSKLRIQKTAIADYGRDLKEASRLSEFARLQERSLDWARQTAAEIGVEAEAESHRVLVQMMNALAFQSLQSRMGDEEEIDPKDLHFYARTMKDIVASSGLREKQLADAEERGAAKAKAEAAEKLDAAVADGAIDKAAAKAAREIMGFA